MDKVMTKYNRNAMNKRIKTQRLKLHLRKRVNVTSEVDNWEQTYIAETMHAKMENRKKNYESDKNR